MKLVSKFALALTAVSVLGSAALAPSAFAQKEKKNKKQADEPAAPRPKLSKGFITAYQKAVAPFAKSDFAAAAAAWPGAKAAIENDDDKYQAGIFAVQLAEKLTDPALRNEGYDLLLASSFTSADTRTQILFQRAAISYDAKDFPAAEIKMIAAYDAGYRKSDIESLIATSFGQQKKYAEAIAWINRGIDAKIAAGQGIPIVYLRQAANYAIRADDTAAINAAMISLVKADNSADNWRDMLNLYMRKAKLTEAETLDVMRLMRVNNAMKYPLEYALYVEAAGSRRYPVEALAVLNAGIDAGHIEKTDADIKDHYTAATALVADDIRSLPSTEGEARTAKLGNSIALTADAFFSQAKYPIAQSLYELALTKGKITDKDGLDRTDRAVMRLGITKALQQDWEGAKAEFAKLTVGKRGEIAQYWSIYTDQQIAKSAATAG